MLCALAALCDAGRAFTLCCVHVEHGIRPPEESRGDARAVGELCEKLNVPCTVVAVAPGRIAAAARKYGLGIEAAARAYRRRIFRREALRTGAAAVLIAHSRDDLLETVFMRFLRGSGPRGLAALPQYAAGAVPILRPLVNISRREITGYLEQRGINWRTDATNRDNAFLRNRVRNKLFPFLDETFPYWRKGVLSLAETQTLAADFIESAGSRISWEVFGEGLRTRSEGFFSVPAIVREQALFQGINRLQAARRGVPAEVPIKRRSLRVFCSGEKNAVDLGSFTIKRTASFVTLARARDSGSERGFSLLIKEQGKYKLTHTDFKGFLNV
jgi:tRNA(Ile)-lysidine synthase